LPSAAHKAARAERSPNQCFPYGDIHVQHKNCGKDSFGIVPIFIYNVVILFGKCDMNDFAKLRAYVARLPRTSHDGSRLWQSGNGEILGQYQGHVLSSVFAPVRERERNKRVGYEGITLCRSESDHTSTTWHALEQAASDDESVELDRLCRLLHLLNFYRQDAALGSELYLSVHQRLLHAVSSNHGTHFRKVIESLDVPARHVHVQLPPSSPDQCLLISYVADNYRRNRFGVLASAVDAQDGLFLLERVRPHAVVLGGGACKQTEAAQALLELCHQLGVKLMFKELDDQDSLEAVRALQAQPGQIVLVQGKALDRAGASLDGAGQPMAVSA
jgi:EAL domain-containing protein (putative c-di-GMP-specific phosphodiesterase class I)